MSISQEWCLVRDYLASRYLHADGRVAAVIARTGDGGCDRPASGGSVNRARLAAGVGAGPRSLGRFWPGTS